MLVLTGHQFIFSSSNKEIFVLHKLVDVVEKENEKGSSSASRVAKYVNLVNS